MAVLKRQEIFVRVTPLIVRCSDTATGQMVNSGLRLTAIPTQNLGVSVGAFTTASGLYGFEGLSGLRDYGDFDEGSLPPGANAAPPVIVSPAFVTPATKRSFLILVEDAAQRYLSWAVALTLPRRDVFPALLFAAPSQAAPPGFSAIRGAITNAARQPASFARIEARYDPTALTPDGVALADARGEFALFLPQPNPLSPPGGAPITSPNTTGRLTIAQQLWPLTLSFAYAPTTQNFYCVRFDNHIETLDGAGIALMAQRTAAGWNCVPDVQSLLTQAGVSAFQTADGASAATISIEMAFGKPTIARTTGGDGSVWLDVP